MGTLTQAGAEEANEAPQAAASKELLKQRTPRVNGAELLRRTFDLDVFACLRCGGRRRVLAGREGSPGASRVDQTIRQDSSKLSRGPRG